MWEKSTVAAAIGVALTLALTGCEDRVTRLQPRLLPSAAAPANDTSITNTSVETATAVADRRGSEAQIAQGLTESRSAPNVRHDH